MSSLHLVDPELVPALEFFPKFDFSPGMLGAVRAQMEQMRLMMPAADDPAVAVEIRQAPGVDGPDVELLIYRPVNQTAALPVVLHLHGGGYILGTAKMTDPAARAWVKELNCVVVSVDYRLAPETPHPGPVEDSYAALKFLADNAVGLKIDPACIGVAGESAGAGLAAALALLARDRGGPSLAFQHLIYPMIDDRTVTTSDPHPYTGAFGWTPENNHFGWASLLGQEPGSEGISPHAAPARAENLAGLPPAYIAVGALDLFLDEDIAYALRLTRAGVPVELHVYPGAYHGFHLAASAPVTLRANRDANDALRRALHPPG